MIVSIHPSLIKGAVQAPASKSSMQRACAAGLLNKGTTVLSNPGHSHDDLAALDTIQKLGATVQPNADGTLTIASSGIAPAGNEINCGESGLGIRMFTPIAGLSDRSLTISGKGSLVTRPMHFFDEIFPKVGIQIVSRGGFLPLQIKGPLQPANIEVDGSLSSQFLTGLLMAYAAADADGVTITVRNLKSKPYIDLTLQVLKSFGYVVTHDQHAYFHFQKRAVVPVQPVRYTVEGDWSGGAFLLVAGAVAGPIVVKGLDVFSTQADKAILQALMDAGAKLSVEAAEICVAPHVLKPFHFDATDCPDLFPPLVALAAYCDGKTVIQGVGRLQHKESNRALTLQEEFGKMGIVVELQDDLMIVHGGGGVKGVAVTSHNDHRIAMACAVAALKAEGDTSIDHAEAINKSYTDFYTDLQQLGALVDVPETATVH